MTKEEFEKLSRRIRPKLLSLAGAAVYSSPGMEAEDVVQETLMRLWELSEQDYPMRDAESIAIRIAKNTCVSYYRRGQLKIQPLTHDNYVGGSESTELTDGDDLKTVKEYLYGALTRTQRKYLHLRNDEEMSLDEIADLTGKPKTSIKSSISSARKQMLDLIKKQL